MKENLLLLLNFISDGFERNRKRALFENLRDMDKQCLEHCPFLSPGTGDVINTVMSKPIAFVTEKISFICFIDYYKKEDDQFSLLVV